MKKVILSIDQGTTSSRTLVFSVTGEILFTAQLEFPQIYPQDGWVEHDPEAFWDTVLTTLKDAIAFSQKENYEIAGIGITNQRETTLVWDRKTGKPLYNAIVWQDRRTAETCREIKSRFDESKLSGKTGLLLDPYFSSTKASWILDHVEGARERAEAGELAFGTVDSFLIWRLTGGKSHATDATNASRTNLFNIRTQKWDDELLSLFNVPSSVLPEVKDCADRYGVTDASITSVSIPILGVAGDQQAAAIGQACFAAGDIKSTYGTGCFVILNTGSEFVRSKNKLLSTVCYRLNGKTTYALEGSIFIAGAAVQWLRDGIGIIKSAEETEAMASGLEHNHGVYLVPAFTGLGAPHWDPDARGALLGITRDTTPDHIARAAVESVCYQTRDLFAAMAEDGVRPVALRVDGGMVHNSWMAQFLSDILAIPVDRPQVLETTALGAAYLAGLQAGLYGSLDDVTRNWKRERRFEPDMEAENRDELTAGWDKAVKRVLL